MVNKYYPKKKKKSFKKKQSYQNPYQKEKGNR